MEQREIGHRVVTEASESAAAVDAALSVFLLLPRFDAAVAASSLSGTHAMIRMWVDCKI